MSEQKVDLSKVDWSKVTDIETVKKITDVKDLEKAAQTGQLSMFANLLELFGALIVIDEQEKEIAKGIDFIKEGVKSCADALERGAKEDLIADFEDKLEQEEELAVADEEVVADDEEAAQEEIAPVEETAPATTSAADSKAFAALREEFRAVAKRMAALETQVSAYEDRIAELESGRQKDQTTVAKLADTVRGNADGVAKLLAGDKGVYERLGILEEAADNAAKTRERAKITSATRRPI